MCSSLTLFCYFQYYHCYYLTSFLDSRQNKKTDTGFLPCWSNLYLFTFPWLFPPNVQICTHLWFKVTFVVFPLGLGTNLTQQSINSLQNLNYAVSILFLKILECNEKISFSSHHLSQQLFCSQIFTSYTVSLKKVYVPLSILIRLLLIIQFLHLLSAI